MYMCVCVCVCLCVCVCVYTHIHIYIISSFLKNKQSTGRLVFKIESPRELEECDDNLEVKLAFTIADLDMPRGATGMRTWFS